MPTFIDSYPVNLRIIKWVQQLNPSITTIIARAARPRLR